MKHNIPLRYCNGATSVIHAGIITHYDLTDLRIIRPYATGLEFAIMIFWHWEDGMLSDSPSKSWWMACYFWEIYFSVWYQILTEGPENITIRRTYI